MSERSANLLVLLTLGLASAVTATSPSSHSSPPDSGRRLACEDAMADHPMCKFGGQCDCVAYASSDGTTDMAHCGTTKVTDRGSQVVNDLCMKTCDACPAATPPSIPPSSDPSTPCSPSPSAPCSKRCSMTRGADTYKVLYYGVTGHPMAHHPIMHYAAKIAFDDGLLEEAIPNWCDFQIETLHTKTLWNAADATKEVPGLLGEYVFKTGARRLMPCVDKIDTAPMCTFGGQCSCAETIAVNPCGTEIASRMGTVAVNDVCAKTCGLTDCSVTDATAGDSGLEVRSTLTALVGDEVADVAKIFASVWGVFNIPQIAPATQDELSLKNYYPYYVRSDAQVSASGKAYAEFVLYFGWRRAIVMGTEDDQEGEGLIKGFTETFGGKGEMEVVTIPMAVWDLKNDSYASMVDLSDREDEYLKVVEEIAAKEYRVLMLVASHRGPGMVLMRLFDHVGLLGPGYVWCLNLNAITNQFTPRSMGGSTPLSFEVIQRERPDSWVWKYDFTKLVERMRGSFTLKPDVLGPYFYSDKWAKLWSTMTREKLVNAGIAFFREPEDWAGAPFANAEDMFGYMNSELTFPGYLMQFDASVCIYNAISKLMLKGTDPKDIYGKKLLDQIYESDFNGVTGRFRVNGKGDRQMSYSFYQLHEKLDDRLMYDFTSTFVKIAEYDSANKSFAFKNSDNGFAALAFNGLSGEKFGDYTTTVPSDTRKPCTAGSEYRGRKQGCQACLPGTYSPSAGLQCIACQAGRSTATAKSSGCANCEPGRSTNDETGFAECELCGKGHFASESGQRQCGPCLKGSYSDKGATACAACPVGFYVSTAQATACDECVGDFTTRYPNSDRIDDCGCAEDQYLHMSPSTCKSCPDGFDCKGFTASGSRVLSKGKRLSEINFTIVHNPPVVKVGNYADPNDPFVAYECLEAKTLCVGGPPGSCGGGRIGLQCSICEAGQVAAVEEPCDDCTGGGFIIYPSMLVAIVVALGAVHKLTSTNRAHAVTQLPLMSIVGQIIAQAQMIVLITSFNVRFPNVITIMLNILSIFIFNMGQFSPSCYFGFGLPARYLPNVLLPIFIIAVMVIFYIVSKLTQKMTKRSMDVNNIMNTLGMVLSALSVAVFKAAMSILECRDNPSADDTLINYDGFHCFGDEVMALMPLTIILTAFFIGLFVGAYGYVLYQGPKLFHQNKVFRQRFRFVVNRWHPTYYWWGALQVARNLFMCLVPVITTNGLVQMAVVAIIFTPVFIVTLITMPWREMVANWNDIVLSSCLIAMMFASAFLVAEPTAVETRNAIGAFMVAAVLLSFVVVFVIAADMAAITYRGKGVFMKGNKMDQEYVSNFVETMTRWTHLSEEGNRDMNDDATRFLNQLPDIDMQRMEWILSLLQTGLFAQKPSRKISGISPVAPRNTDEHISAMQRKSSKKDMGPAGFSPTVVGVANKDDKAKAGFDSCTPPVGEPGTPVEAFVDQDDVKV